MIAKRMLLLSAAGSMLLLAACQTAQDVPVPEDEQAKEWTGPIKTAYPEWPGVSFELLLATKCSDYEALSDFAKKYQSEQPHVSAAASAKRSRIIRGDSEGAKSHGDMFADAVSDLF